MTHTTWIPLAALAAIACTTGQLTGCTGRSPADDRASPVVFVDVETRQTVLQPQTGDVPAVNPSTGRRTLMPGLYCEQCRQWHPAPPLEEFQRNPRTHGCPVCRSPLVPKGPLPAE